MIVLFSKDRLYLFNKFSLPYVYPGSSDLAVQPSLNLQFNDHERMIKETQVNEFKDNTLLSNSKIKLY